MNLPEEFLSRMKSLLGNEYDDYIKLAGQGGSRGIRVNPLKCNPDKLRELVDFNMKKSPFCRYGYYIPQDYEGIGNLALHHAGSFYVQEPSASSAVTVLSPEKGDRVLDLCAAPGGKSTQIAGELMGTGLLWSNEIVPNRANILLSNMERLGVSEAVVSCAHPEQLCMELEGFFDKVLVDAPCSGEGMFLHDEKAIADWSLEHTLSCGVRQKGILDSAAKALKNGGIMVYSTCTYSIDENEAVVEDFLKSHSDFELLDCGVEFGRPSAVIPQTRRIFPMDGGDGHFIAKLRKTGEAYAGTSAFKSSCEKSVRQMAEELYEKMTGLKLKKKLHTAGSNVYLLPDEMPEFGKVRILRAGVHFGVVMKNRLEPAHHFFTSADQNCLKNIYDINCSSAEAKAFLKGETLNVDSSMKGYCGVSVNNIMLGFGKCSGGVLKNHYPKGLRNLK